LTAGNCVRSLIRRSAFRFGKCFVNRYGVPVAYQPPDFAGVLNVSGRARYGNYAKVLQI